MDKVNNMQEQMGNICWEMEILRKTPKEMLEIKNTITKMKNAFDVLISRLDMIEERIPELEDMSIDASKTEKQREKWLKRKVEQDTQGLWRTAKGVTYR